MARLTLEERGAYNTILDLIYSHGGSVDDDDRFLAGWMRCDVRVWRRLRGRLLELGKLYVHGGHLRNKRADREVEKAIDRVNRSIQAGLASAAKRNAEPNNSNGLGGTLVERTLQQSTPTSTSISTSTKELPRRESFTPKSLGRLASQPISEGTKRPSDVSRSQLDEAFARRRKEKRGLS